MYSSSGSSNAPLPSWATPRSNDSAPAWANASQPLVRTVDLPAVKKEVKQDLKEIRAAVDSIAKLAKKRDGRDVGPQVLSLSDQVRRRARSTTAKIRDALGNTPEGSTEYAALAKLSEELKATLRDFQKNVEAASGGGGPSSSSVSSSSSNALVVAPLQNVVVDQGGGQPQPQMMQQQMQQDVASEEQLRAVATNEMVIADREIGIDGIARSVQELHEIFEDINALVTEQGEHIDNIQTNIEKASNHQAAAVTELVAASRHQRRSRKCMCWIIVLVIVLLAVLMVALQLSGSFH